jgi:hypothetical protein
MNTNAHETQASQMGKEQSVSLRVLSCVVLCCLVLSCLVLSWLALSCLVWSCLVLSGLVLSCVGVFSCALGCVASCVVLCSLMLSCRAMSCVCPVLSRLLSCLVLHCLILSCLVLHCFVLLGGVFSLVLKREARYITGNKAIHIYRCRVTTSPLICHVPYT